MKKKCKRLLSILIVLIMVAEMFPTTASASDLFECEFCGEMGYVDNMCSGGEHHGSSSSHTDCYEEHHCDECGACADAAEWCEVCLMHVDCAQQAGRHCVECGACFDDVEEVEGTGMCYDCIESEGDLFCLDCGKYAEDVMICAECGRCEECVEYCYSCELCVECAADAGLHCFDCFGCVDDCYLCYECGLCEDCAGGYCHECELCLMCAADAGDHCTECLNCGSEYYFCLGCELCEECTEFCYECALCVECAASEGLHCPACWSCCLDDYLCYSCGMCRDCAEGFCENCEMCPDCAAGEGLHCYGCMECIDEHYLCESCGLCEECADEFCIACGMCVDCAAEEGWHCSACGNCGEGFYICCICGDCEECADELCVDCEMCVSCAAAEGLHCLDCSRCWMEVDCCYSCGLCEVCAEHICECGVCALCEDYCLECEQCLKCCIEDATHCFDCGVCFFSEPECYDSAEAGGAPLCVDCCMEAGYHCKVCEEHIEGVKDWCTAADGETDHCDACSGDDLQECSECKRNFCHLCNDNDEAEEGGIAFCEKCSQCAECAAEDHCTACIACFTEKHACEYSNGNEGFNGYACEDCCKEYGHHCSVCGDHVTDEKEWCTVTDTNHGTRNTAHCMDCASSNLTAECNGCGQKRCNLCDDGMESVFDFDNWFCESCGYCLDCITTKYLHCSECENCYVDSPKCEYSDDCFDGYACENCCVAEGHHCQICTKHVTGNIDWCPVCGDAEGHCEECFEDLSFECACGTQICPYNVSDEYCDLCYNHPDCAIDNDFHCGECYVCYEQTPRCGQDGTHCVTCCEENGWLCKSCQECVEGNGMELCEYCGLCTNCCMEKSMDEGCISGEVCVESGAFEDHICQQCTSVCSCDYDFCEDCGLCMDCCADNAASEGCSSGEVCIESSDWTDHVCADCQMSCECDGDFCEDCGYCMDCCNSNAETAGCFHGVCVESVEWTEHYCDYCGCCFEDCDCNGLTGCPKCPNTSHEHTHNWVDDICTVCGAQKDGKPVIVTQPRDAHTLVSDSAKGASEYHTVTFRVGATGENLSYQWYRKTNNGAEVKLTDSSGENGLISGSGTNTLTTFVGTDECHNPNSYYCVVTNAAGSVASDAASVNADHSYRLRAVDDEYHQLCCIGENACKAVTGEKKPHSYGAWQTSEGNMYRECRCGFIELRADTDGKSVKYFDFTLPFMYSGESIEPPVSASDKVELLSYRWLMGEDMSAVSGGSFTDGERYRLEIEARTVGNVPISPDARGTVNGMAAEQISRSGTRISFRIDITAEKKTIFEPVIIVQPQSVHGVLHSDWEQGHYDTADFSVQALGDGLTYEWFLRPGDEDAQPYKLIDGLYGTGLDTGHPTINVLPDVCYFPRQIYCVVSNEYGSAESECVTLTADHVYRWWQEDEENHVWRCIGDACTEDMVTEPHSFGKWTLDRNQNSSRTCSVCGYIEYKTDLSKTPVTNIPVEVQEPAAGSLPTAPKVTSYMAYVESYVWRDRKGNEFTGRFLEGEEYRLSVTVRPAYNYPLAEKSELTVTVNGEEVSFSGSDTVYFSKKFTAQRISGAPVILVQPQNAECRANAEWDSVYFNPANTATFRVTAAGENLSYEWYWQYNGVPYDQITDDAFASGSATNCLKVVVPSECCTQEIGVYCVVRNAAGSITSSPALFNARHVYRWVYEDQDYHRYKCIGLECEAGINDKEHLAHRYGEWTTDAVGNHIKTCSTCKDQKYLETYNRKYAITYELNGGYNSLSNPKSYDRSVDTAINPPAPHSGYIFLGWYNNANFGGSPVTVIPRGSTGDIRLYAKWEYNQYTVTYKLKGGRRTSDGSTEDIVEYRSVEVPGAWNFPRVERIGYDFGGWYMDEAYNERVPQLSASFFDRLDITEMTLYAKWIPGTPEIKTIEIVIPPCITGNSAQNNKVTLNTPGCTSRHANVIWQISGYNTTFTGTFESSNAYRAVIVIDPAESSYFSEALTATINGEGANVQKNEDGSVTVYTTFRTDNIYGTWGTCQWELNASSGYLTIYSGTGKDQPLKVSPYSPWVNYKDMIHFIHFKCSKEAPVILPARCAGLFRGLDELLRVEVYGELDCSQLTNTSDMFRDCSSMYTLDGQTSENGFVWKLDTSRVTTMFNMFGGCSGLKYGLDFDKYTDAFVTSSCTNMVSMFRDCSNAASFDLSCFDTSKVRDMAGMFNGCSSAETINVSSFDTSSVTKMSNMFNGCSAVTALDLALFDTAKVTDMTDMFKNCTSLQYLDISGFDSSNAGATIGTGFFGNDTALKYLVTGERFSFGDAEIQVPTARSVWMNTDTGNKYVPIDVGYPIVRLPNNVAATYKLESEDIPLGRISISIPPEALPRAGQPITDEAVNLTTTNEHVSFVPSLDGVNNITKWSYGESDTEFQAGKEYSLYFVLRPEEGYQFIDPFAVTLLGIPGSAEATTETGVWPAELGGEFGGCGLGFIYYTVPRIHYDLTTQVSGGHGFVSPGGTGIEEGTVETVTFFPDEYYVIDTVTVNGKEAAVTGNTLAITMNESKNVVVTYKHVCVPGIAWLSDLSSHWHSCEACGEKTDTAVHSGGLATCTRKAECQICGVEYGGLAAHSYGGTWHSDASQHWRVCTECGGTSAAERHDYADRTDSVCDVCGYDRNLTYEVTVTPDGKSFVSVKEGYAAPAAETFTIRNLGSGILTNISVTITGANSDSFTVDTSGTLSTLNKNMLTKFTVAPNADLPAGEYTAVIEVTADRIAKITRSVSFTVTPGEYAVEGRIISWNNEDNAEVRLYDASVSDGDIKADAKLQTPQLGAAATSRGAINPNVDGKRYDQTFRFDGVTDGSYKLAIYKIGHMPKIVSVTVSGSGVTEDVELFLLGDVNHDGKIRTGDAILIYKHLAGTPLANDRLPEADTTGDGKIRTGDATQIYKYLAGDPSSTLGK